MPKVKFICNYFSCIIAGISSTYRKEQKKLSFICDYFLFLKDMNTNDLQHRSGLPVSDLSH